MMYLDEAELDQLRSVFTRLIEEAGLKLSPKKCHLFKKRVVFLGHVVSEDGVSTDPEKIRASVTGQPQFRHLPCAISWVFAPTTAGLSAALPTMQLPSTV